MDFPYLVKDTSLGKIWTPYCWIEVLTAHHVWRKYKFLFDSGADYTTIPRFMNSVVGIDITRAKQEIMYTVSKEPIKTFVGNLHLRFDVHERTIPCVLTDSDDTPFLLGRAGLIEHFDMLFSAQFKKLTINR